VNGPQFQNGGQFSQNGMANLMQRMQQINAELSKMNMTPQQYLEQALTSGQITQQQYEEARRNANQLMGTNY